MQPREQCGVENRQQSQDSAGVMCRTRAALCSILRVRSIVLLRALVPIRSHKFECQDALLTPSLFTRVTVEQWLKSTSQTTVLSSERATSPSRFFSNRRVTSADFMDSKRPSNGMVFQQSNHDVLVSVQTLSGGVLCVKSHLNINQSWRDTEQVQSILHSQCYSWMILSDDSDMDVGRATSTEGAEMAIAQVLVFVDHCIDVGSTLIIASY